MAGGAAGRAPPRLQLRRALGDFHSRGLSRPLPPLSAPASSLGDAAEVDPVFLDRDGGRLGALLRTDDGGGRFPPGGSPRQARPARGRVDPAVPAPPAAPTPLRESIR